MACFLGCFGFSKKRKRPKSGHRVLFGDQGHGSYEPISSDSKFSDEHKDRLSSKIKKKVSFNLNVRTYEPIQKEEANDHFSDGEPEKATISTVEPENNSTGSRTGSFPSNHRYQSFRDSYDEDDDIELEESDIDDEFDDTDDEEEEEDSHETDNYDDDFDYDNNGPKTSQKEYLNPNYSSKNELGKRVDFPQLNEDETGNFSHIRALRGEEVKKIEPSRSVRDRSQYAHSVLNPVENLTQWKAVKARATPTVKKQKENIGTKQEQIPSDHSKPLIQGFAVDSSLSTWLNSSNTETAKTMSLKKNE